MFNDEQISLTEATVLALQGKLKIQEDAKRERASKGMKKESVNINVDDGGNTTVDTEEATVTINTKKQETPITAEPQETIDVPVEGDETIVPEEEVSGEEFKDLEESKLLRKESKLNEDNLNNIMDALDKYNEILDTLDKYYDEAEKNPENNPGYIYHDMIEIIKDIGIDKDVEKRILGIIYDFKDYDRSMELENSKIYECIYKIRDYVIDVMEKYESKKVEARSHPLSKVSGADTDVRGYGRNLKYTDEIYRLLDFAQDIYDGNIEISEGEKVYTVGSFNVTVDYSLDDEEILITDIVYNGSDSETKRQLRELKSESQRQKLDMFVYLLNISDDHYWDGKVEDPLRTKSKALQSIKYSNQKIASLEKQVADLQRQLDGAKNYNKAKEIQAKLDKVRGELDFSREYKSDNRKTITGESKKVEIKSLKKESPSYDKKSFEEALTKFYKFNSKKVESFKVKSVATNSKGLKVEGYIVSAEAKVPVTMIFNKKTEGKTYTKYTLRNTNGILKESKDITTNLMVSTLNKTLECKYIISK